MGQIPNVPPYLMASSVDIIRWAMLAFQVWMLVDAIRREDWFWAVFIGLAVFYWNSFGLSAILYYLLVYRQHSSGPSFSGFELPGTFDRRRIRELEAKIHHLDNAQHHLGLADIYFQQGKYEKAEQTYREALKRDAEDVDIRAHLGQCLLRLGKAEEALALLQKVAQDDPKHDYGFTLMALAETHTKLGSPDSAIQIWERVLENHSYPRARVQLAELLLQKNETEKARSILQETLADEQHGPAFQRRRDRVWISRAKALLRQVRSRETRSVSSC
jgi:tetratricopeptide (TPR) repeat protein